MSEPARILVVDDEPDLLNLSTHLLRRAGYEVVGAATGEEGWRLIQDLHPDLVLLDVMLPDIDGLEVCRRIKRDPSLAGVPVVFLSALRTTSMSQAAGLEAGGDDYISRPITSREFLARVQSILRSRRTQAASGENQEVKPHDSAQHERTEAELRWEEVILSTIADPMSYVDRGYVYRFVNETYSRYAKRPRQEIVGQSVADILGVGIFAQYVKPYLDRCFAGEEIHYQAWFDIPGEEKKYMAVGYYPVHDGNGRVLGAVVNSRDITGLQRAEQALKESEARLELAIEGSNGGLWHIQLDLDEPSHTLPDEIYLSARLRHLIGYEDHEFPNSLAAWESRVLPEDLEALRESSRKCREGLTQSHEVEYRIRHKDGSIRWLYTRGAIQRTEDGKPILFAGIDWDITARKQAEEALRRERDLVTRVMETSPVGIVVLDREGRITYANAQVQRVTGLGREQIAQLPYNDPTWRMVDKEGQSLSDDQLPFPRVMGSGETICNLRQEVELPGGQKLLLSMNAAPLCYPEGQTDGVVITIEDVTEQTRMHEQIQRHAAELEQRVAERTAELEASQMALLQAERLAIAGKLAASLTHEISNPLQAVIGCLGLAEEARAEGQDVGEYLDIALSELRRVARIVARLRNMGHPPSTLSVKEPTDVGLLLNQVIGLSQKKCQEQGIEIDASVDEPLPNLSLVPDQIEQVLLNLMINAIDAMPEGGRLSIRASPAGSAGPSGPSDLAGPDGLYISFADTGAGIAADVLPHIFDPFYSTKPENLGLGLSICRDIIQQHGGHIEVESQLGAGSRFTIFLPV